MTLPDMALRFILNNPTVSTVIPGMRKVKNVEENLRAAGEGPLPSDLYAELRKHAGPGRGKAAELKKLWFLALEARHRR